MLTVVTWLWGAKFGPDDVARLAASVRRHIAQPHRFVCVSDRDLQLDGVEREPIWDVKLTAERGCFARLRMFDPAWQADIGVADRFVCIDLDTVITGSLDPLFDRDEPLVIMQGANLVNPCPFNGALMMLRYGAHRQVFHEFSWDEARKVAFHDFPDDQGWIHHKVPDAAGWKVGSEHGVYVWQKRGWPGGDDLPADARLVTFVNKRPSDLAHLKWVRKHWRQ